MNSLGRAGADARNTITFYLNGNEQTVLLTGKTNPTRSLNDYIRVEAGLTGTKVMCREGGCGCCAVTVTMEDHLSHKMVTRSINSCLCPLLSVAGWQVTTVEGLGSEKNGYHPIQKRIAAFNGTQCGYCTPGMVMTMYGLLHENPQPTEQEVEDNFDGNICRCTGYRPILDCMKSFATDTKMSGATLIDIEDLNLKLCPRTGETCKGCHQAAPSGSHKMMEDCVGSLRVHVGGSLWFRPTSLPELGEIMRYCQGKSVHLLFGNTSAGIYKDDGLFEVYIDLREVRELYKVQDTEKCVKFGANTSLTDLIKSLKELQNKQPGFGYFKALVRHLKLVGNVLMRNVASVAGNLMLKHTYPEFPSDVFTIAEAAGGVVDVYDCMDGTSKSYPVQELIKTVDMRNKVLVALELPALDVLHQFRSYKITPRSQNTHTYVNAAFKIKVSEDSRILEKPSIVIGGISENFFHAEETECFLAGKEIKDAIVKEALSILQNDLKPIPDDDLSPAQYRHDLAVNLLYKTLLGIAHPSDPRLMSGGENVERPLSSGVQTWENKTEEWPLNKPLARKSAHQQASGEAEFVNDMPRFKHELCGSLVLSTAASATIDFIDPAPALAMIGVEHFISAYDIPEGGINNAFANFQAWPFPFEEVFSTGKVEYAGQAVGMILAENQMLADEAARKVIVKYLDVQKPILSIEDALAAKSFHPIFNLGIKTIGNPEEAMAQSAKVIEGKVRIGQQYHFYIETVSSLCIPTQNGMDAYVTTQSSDCIQVATAAILNKPINYVNVHVPRLGGSFGGKIFLACHLALATAVAAYATGRPVRSSASLSNTMKQSGKRPHVLVKYKVGFSQEGKLNAIFLDLYVDNGKSWSMQFIVMDLISQMDQAYYCPNWKISPCVLKTNKAPGALVRGPGTTPACVIIESILEHVAKTINMHPIMVKGLNLYEEEQNDLTGTVLTKCTLKEVWEKLKTIAEVHKRMDEIAVFNQSNQWKKRGITMSAVKYGMHLPGQEIPVMLSVYSTDGTVTVIQGGVEMGQGLYMKVAQAVAYSLGIPIELVKVQPNITSVVPDSPISGAMASTEQAVNSALDACKALMKKLEPVKEELGKDVDWQTLVMTAMKKSIDLVAIARSDVKSQTHFTYYTYSAAVAETELDVLTGEYAIRRVDIMFDCGESQNPMTDVGQVEGGFVFGLGFSLLEDVIYDKKTGVVLNDGTWEYKPPTTKDIPIDWRVHLLSDATNPLGIIRSSKAIGEPPTGLSVAVLLALKQSAENAKEDIAGVSTFIPVDVPFTVDKIQQSIGVKLEHLKM